MTTITTITTPTTTRPIENNNKYHNNNNNDNDNSNNENGSDVEQVAAVPTEHGRIIERLASTVATSLHEASGLPYTEQLNCLRSH